MQWQTDTYLDHLSMFINIRTDFGFKKIFGSPENKHILIRFLNALFGDDIRIEDVTYLDKEMLPKDSDGKRIIYDVYCTSQNGDHHFILEMQNEYKTPFEERVSYYTSRIIPNREGRDETMH